MSGSFLSRRGLLLAGGAVAAWGLGGCDLRGGDSSPHADATPDPDEAIVTAARQELTGLITRLSADSSAAALVTVHRTQLRALQGDPPSTTGGRAPMSRQQTVARERRAAARFTRWSNAAESGDLARVLASIAAGIRVQPVLRDAS